ncbi:YihY/virulence factor BrkB family protein [Streptomyces sp. NPDC046324]|uniref:YihY/virulence factor BrkB family protein n=1 Tax=Streptomyces sp. NPDC046324 TaxID=3154915 RepID=UPI0033E75E43
MCQVERGTNRVYGVERDRPFLSKDARGTVMAVLAGLPLGLSFLLTVLGSDLTRAFAEVCGVGPDATRAWEVLRWPVGVLLAVPATSAIFRLSPRRDQPGYTWPAFGAILYLVPWNGAACGLSLYVGASGSFTSVYGPLSAIMALLLWSYPTSLALFLGVAFAAQLERLSGPAWKSRPDPIPASEAPEARGVVALRSCRFSGGGGRGGRCRRCGGRRRRPRG